MDGPGQRGYLPDGVQRRGGHRCYAAGGLWGRCAPRRKSPPARVVGVTGVEFLDYPDGIIEYGLPLRRDLSRVIRHHRPEVLITLNYHLKFASGSLEYGRSSQCGLGRSGRR